MLWLAYNPIPGGGVMDLLTAVKLFYLVYSKLENFQNKIFSKSFKPFSQKGSKRGD